MHKKINVGVVGFGLSGRAFHSPFIYTNPNFNLCCIVSSKEDSKKIYPEVEVVKELDLLLEKDHIELVVISTPNHLHFEQAQKALMAGKHVILEKPLTPTANEVIQLSRIAKENHRLLIPYHNFRWNGDAQTVKKIIEDGFIGQVHHYEVHFDRYQPRLSRNPWRYTDSTAGGTLYDLGVHLIDHTLTIFGKPEALFCRLFIQREGSIVDDSFDLQLIYKNKNVRLKAGVFVREVGARFTVHGTKGSFVKCGIDPQEAILRNGGMPIGERWGMQQEEEWGVLNTDINGLHVRGKVETIPGDYHGFYDNVYDTMVNNKPPEVTLEQAYDNMLIIEKAIESDKKGMPIKI
ncbi:Gfo/Idh/MocA family oxidoreductase [Prolixibacteraceae bacterium]|nr:Gfo/Idh/MocA family oxidoreductase [Prolixibacteraceae bacterium]